MTKRETAPTIAMIGGDERECTIAAFAATRYGLIRVFGFSLPETPISGVIAAASPAEAAQGASVLLLPLPGMKALSVFAPLASEAVVVDSVVMEAMVPAARIICGHASPEFAGLVGKYGFRLIEYEHDEAGRCARAPAIAEGAISSIVQNTDRTIRGSRVALLGFGVVGAHVAQALQALSADVTILARSAEQRDAASAAAFAAQPLEALAHGLDRYDMLVSTIPARVISRDILKKIPSSCAIFDLASPPGSIDHTAAEQLGMKVIWARGLGSTSPASVGQAQWTLIERLIEG